MSLKIDKMFKIDFIALNESIMIQLQFATNRIKIDPLEPVIESDKGKQSHYARPLPSRDVISLQPLTISLVTLYNCFLTMQDYAEETQEISDAQLTYRHCESRMSVIYSSTRDARWLCYYLLSLKVTFFTSESFHRSQF